MKDLITDPEEFFAQRAENPGIFVPVGIVVAASLIAAIGAMPEAAISGPAAAAQAADAGQQVNESAQDLLGSLAGGFSVGAAFLGVLIAWIFYTIVFYLLAGVFSDGNGSFSGTLAFVGWGFVPSVVAQIVNAAAAYYVFGGVTLPEGDPAIIETYNELQADPVLLAASVVALLLLLWSGVLWMYGMKQLHKISQRRAAAIVWIPVGLSVLFRISNLV